MYRMTGTGTPGLPQSITCRHTRETEDGKTKLMECPILEMSSSVLENGVYLNDTEIWYFNIEVWKRIHEAIGAMIAAVEEFNNESNTGPDNGASGHVGHGASEGVSATEVGGEVPQD